MPVRIVLAETESRWFPRMLAFWYWWRFGGGVGVLVLVSVLLSVVVVIISPSLPLQVFLCYVIQYTVVCPYHPPDLLFGTPFQQSQVRVYG